MKVCIWCGQTKPLSDFHKNGSAFDHRCKPCRKTYDTGRKKRSGLDIRRNATENAKARKRKWNRSNRDLLKEHARRAVREAVKHGLLVVSDNCEHCGKSQFRRDGVRAVQAHHYLGYEHPLAIQWLCAKCHRAVHADAALAREDKP